MKLQNAPAQILLLLLILVMIHEVTEAQHISSSFISTSSSNNPHAPNSIYKYSSVVAMPIPRLSIKRGGFNTSRLSNEDLKKWKIIEKIAIQKGPNDQILFPTLNGLWQWAAHTEHTIVIEIISSSDYQSNSAGSISIESFDHACFSHTITLKLFPGNIDNALISPRAARKNGFIAFQFLKKKEERYAEVLGHELSHAKFILKNNLRTRMVNELIEVTNESILVNAHENSTGNSSPFLRDRISQRDTLLKELEAEAEANEEIIWNELVAATDKKKHK